MVQVRVPIARIQSLLVDLVEERITWDSITSRFTIVTTAQDEDDAEDDVHDEDVPAEDTRYAGHVAGQLRHCAF